ncbi:MAG TPA: MarR family winged helix-turn-helix transcriptional regulator [Polyangia bacterium]
MPRHKTVRPLEAHLGFWLRFVSNHVSQAFSRRLAAHEVSVAEWVVLRELLEQDGALPSDLAERLGMTRGAISKLADRLEAKGLASRRTDKVDRRYQALRITAKGRALVPALAALADENDAEFFDHLTRKERERVVAIMKEIVRRHGLRTTPVD